MVTNIPHCFIIAEAGVNHNGSVDLAHELIDAAAHAGVDAVKFQTFRTDRLVAKHAPKAEYQTRTTDAGESQFEMIRKLELTERDHELLISHAREKCIKFMSTPFDSESLNLLTGRFSLSTIKVSSGDITNAPFLLQIARVAQEVILSTGMSNLAEVEAALGVLAFGFVSSPSALPHRAAFEQAYISAEGRRMLEERVAILHCTTEYPAPVNEVNLRALDTIATAFGLRTGYSDHTVGIHIPVAAVARGARIIEKHFTLDRNLPGPDHTASLEPNELRDMVAAIRDVELSLGDSIKRPSPSEWKNRAVARKSLVVDREVLTGEPLKLACKRPGIGLSPFEFWNWADKPASRPYAADEMLDG
jgi:N-acetylneuraminate synthase